MLFLADAQIVDDTINIEIEAMCLKFQVMR